MTPAVVMLEKAKVDHEVRAYDHDPNAESYGNEAVEALGLDPSTVFKTLLAVVDGSETVVAVVPVANRLDLKALAKTAGGKKATMADPADAERLTGYVVGGISPLGQRRKLRTFIDATAESLDHMHVSAGRRGLEVTLAPTELGRLLSAAFASIAAD
ncbi:MAG: Cys-tRNA(Pro) deacylase [Acidimicrobiia bacterium]|nr:Cys-tRNA(Pro) deacylase [Acidimicrobiia bacterium]